MKLTKQTLEQLITENLENYQAEQLAKGLGQKHATAGLVINTEEDMENYYRKFFKKVFPNLDPRRYETLYLGSFIENKGEINIPDPGGETIEPEQDDLI